MLVLVLVLFGGEVTGLIEQIRHGTGLADRMPLAQLD